MATFTDNELRSFLEKIPLFPSIPYNQLRWLSKLFKPVSVKKGDVICKEGEPGDTMFIIKSGSVGVYVAKEGNEMFVSYLHRGDFFGELSLLRGWAHLGILKVFEDKGEHIMPTLAEQWTQQGLQQGKLQSVRESVVENLEARFDVVPRSVVKRIDEIEELSLLKILHKKSVVVDSLGQFKEVMARLME